MKYIDAMKELNELDKVMNWDEDFRFSVEVALDNNFADCSHMGVSDFIGLCVELATI